MAANDYSKRRTSMGGLKSRSNRDPNSPGMSTKGKNDSRNRIVIRFDFRDYDLSIRQATESVRQANYDMRKEQKKLNRTDKGFGVFIDYRDLDGKELKFDDGKKFMTFEVPQNGKFLSSDIGRGPAKEIGRLGAQTMRKYVNRIDTGLMKGSITYMQRRRGNNIVDVEIGWVRRWHQYFGWQEDGTRGGQGNGRGIKPMYSLARTYKEMAPRAQMIYSEFFTKKFLQKGNNK